MRKSGFFGWTRLAISCFALGISVVAFGCGASSGTQYAPPSAQHLSKMVLPPVQLPKSDLTLSHHSGRIGASAAANFVPEQDADVYGQGWVDGYAIIQDPPQDFDPFQFELIPQGQQSNESSVIQTMNYVALFDSEMTASTAMQAQKDRIVQADPEAGIINAEVLPVEKVGEDAYAARLDTVGETSEVYLTTVVFRHGELLGGVVFVQMRREDTLDEVRRLAGELEEQIVSVLRGEGPKNAWRLPEPPVGNTLGLRCSTASYFLRTRYGLEPGEGCVVLRVGAYSAAERAGFRIGDRIVELDGRTITSGRQFTYEFEQRPSLGPSHSFTVDRGKERLTIRVVLGAESYAPAYDPYEDYLMGRGNPDSAEAISYFTKAMAKDPNFDLAYVYRGQERMHVAPFLDDAYPARGDLEAALRLDPELAEAHEAMANWIAASSTGTPEAALVELDAAIRYAGCQPPIGSWDGDCGRLLRSRADLYMIMKSYDLAAGDLTAVANVEDGAEEVELAWDRLDKNRRRAQ